MNASTDSALLPEHLSDVRKSGLCDETNEAARLIAVKERPTLTLASLAEKINEAHAGVEQAQRRTVGQAVQIGEWLLEAKHQVGHGAWVEWQKRNLHFHQTQASRYMRVAESSARLKSAASIRAALRVLVEDDHDEAIEPVAEESRKDSEREHRQRERALTPLHGPAEGVGEPTIPMSPAYEAALGVISAVRTLGGDMGLRHDLELVVEGIREERPGQIGAAAAVDEIDKAVVWLMTLRQRLSGREAPRHDRLTKSDDLVHYIAANLKHVRRTDQFLMVLAEAVEDVVKEMGSNQVTENLSNTCVSELETLGKRVKLSLETIFDDKAEHPRRGAGMKSGRAGVEGTLSNQDKSAGASPRARLHAHQWVIRQRKSLEDPRRALPSLAGCRVEAITNQQARSVIVTYEWLGNMGRSQAAYGLLSPQRELLGAVCLGLPGSPESRDICGPAYRERAVCLERGACIHWAPRNAASYLIRHAVRLAHKDHGWSIFFAYADPEAGEIGTVYQACGWLYLGQGLGRASGRLRQKWLRPDGTIVGDRVLRHLGLKKRDALAQGWVLQHALPKHKYVWFEGGEGEALKRLAADRYAFLPYPKRWQDEASA